MRCIFNLIHMMAAALAQVVAAAPAKCGLTSGAAVDFLAVCSSSFAPDGVGPGDLRAPERAPSAAYAEHTII
jgi:hypothetical protein